MVHTDFYKISIKDIWKKKFSTSLTILSISLGILSIFVILSITQSFNQSIEAQLETFGANKIMVQKTSGADERIFTQNTIDGLERNANIEEIYGLTQARIQIENGGEFRTVSVLASELSEDFLDDMNLDIKRGIAPDERSDFIVVLGPLAAEELFSQELSVGSSISIANTRFRVSAILEEVGNPQDDNTVYMQYSVLEDFGVVDDFDMLSVTISDTERVDSTQENIEIYFERNFGEEQVNVLTSRDILNQLNSITGLITSVLGGIGVISLIVGALGILNTMFVIVTEKIKDIGIMKSIGAQNSTILLFFMIQAATFGVLGAIIGVGIGCLALYGIQLTLQILGYTFLTIVYSPLIMFQMLIFGTIVGVLSGLLPSYVASKISVIDTLRM
ncbi:MAG: ABC transporter permease [Candidatus Nanoarchaeia archaeon]